MNSWRLRKNRKRYVRVDKFVLRELRGIISGMFSMPRHVVSAPNKQHKRNQRYTLGNLLNTLPQIITIKDYLVEYIQGSSYITTTTTTTVSSFVWYVRIRIFWSISLLLFLQNSSYMSYKEFCWKWNRARTKPKARETKLLSIEEPLLDWDRIKKKRKENNWSWNFCF